MASSRALAAPGRDDVCADTAAFDALANQRSTAERAERRLLVHAELRTLEQADRIQPFPGPRREVRPYTTLEPCLMCMGAAMSFMLPRSSGGARSRWPFQRSKE